jgi:redox-sensitive bicupin YhaK (pirin superfamily)
MEIITIPLEGRLQHRDSMGNEGVISKGEVQVMSAGTGIQHSEKNVSGETLKLLQIWVFPDKKNVAPRYDQRAFDLDASLNQLVNIVSPMDKGEGLQIHQDAWFHLGKLEKGKKIDYTLKDPAHGVYAFVIDGSVSINEQELGRRDGAGITETDRLHINAREDAEILLMEVPL